MTSKGNKDQDIGLPASFKVRDVLHIGRIKWVGIIDGNWLYGLKMNHTHDSFCDGSYNGEKYFDCEYKKGIFLSEKAVKVLKPQPCNGIKPSKNIDGSPYKKNPRGIQGDTNSCYMDATLFSMFSGSTVFDHIFHKPYDGSQHIKDYGKIQEILKYNIAYQLRGENQYVPANSVWPLRRKLGELTKVSGLEGEQKDPEEFINSLFDQAMKAEPFLKINKQSSQFFQVFYDKGETDQKYASIQDIFDGSFSQQNLKLSEIPSCLILQMPRFGTGYRLFDRIIPSLKLDIGSVLETGLELCTICNDIAVTICENCDLKILPRGMVNGLFCRNCFRKRHNNCTTGRQTDANERYFKAMRNIKKKCKLDEVPTCLDNQVMDLLAVICIETSHYVTFVKCGEDKKRPWMFFDSMADRADREDKKGGFNIPHVTHIPEFEDWVNRAEAMFQQNPQKRDLPPLAQRLFCDNFIIIYESHFASMYK